jgi:hypothetical protein
MSSRRESSFTLKGQDGSRRTFTILSTVTPDDLVRIGLKAYVLEKRKGVEYESPFSREVRDMLVNSRITQRG